MKPSWQRSRGNLGHKTVRVRFIRSRSEFSRLITKAGLLFSEFSTMPDNVRQSAALTTNMSTYVRVGLSFSAVRSGLPFDFGLHPGLVHLQTRRQLSEVNLNMSVPSCMSSWQSQLSTFIAACCGNDVRSPWVRPVSYTEAWRRLSQSGSVRIDRWMTGPALLVDTTPNS